MVRVFDDARIIKIISVAYPDFKIETIERLGVGMDCEVYQINNKYAFKFPKHYLASCNLYREKSILLQIENQLPIQVPKIEFVGEPNHVFDKYFIGYQTLSGEILTPELYQTLSESVKDQIAGDIAGFLKILHQVKITGDIEGLVIERRTKYLQDYKKIKELLLPVLSTSQWEKVEKMYDELFCDNTLYTYTSGLTHNDLDGGHILFCKSTQRICGVIDFGSAQIADVDNDFMMLIVDSVADYGEELGLQVLKYYGHPNIANVFAKAQMIEKYWMFQQILFSVEFQDDSWYSAGLEKIKNL
jgi:aminoglycoside 2''-phosphotransferase